jgi:hypothetical protein
LPANGEDAARTLQNFLPEYIGEYLLRKDWYDEPMPQGKTIGAYQLYYFQQFDGRQSERNAAKISRENRFKGMAFRNPENCARL